MSDDIHCAACGEACDPDTHECAEEEPVVVSETTKRLQAMSLRRREAAENGHTDYPCPEVGCEFVGKSKQALGGHKRTHNKSKPEPAEASPEPAAAVQEPPQAVEDDFYIDVTIRVPRTVVPLLCSRDDTPARAVCALVTDYLADLVAPIPRDA